MQRPPLGTPQVPAVQVPVRHCVAAEQLVPLGWPQVPLTHWPPAHCASREQLAPPGDFATQAPATQALEERQFESLAQVLLQAPAVQVPLRQAEGAVQAPSFGCPHWPSAPHSLAAHWVAVVQLAPFAFFGAHWPPRHARPEPH